MTLDTRALSIESTISSETDNQITFARHTSFQLALNDFKLGLMQWPIWLMLAYQDIKLRYRRSVLGPFWITISMAITVYTMGYLYSHLFHIDLQTYYPFLVGGMLSWALISTAVTELVDTFTTLEGMIKQIKLPYSLYMHRVAARNILIFFHNILVIVPILIIFHQSAKVNLNTLFLFAGLAILYINMIFYGLIFAMIGARYRDISQVIKSLIQVVFFLTPVMWSPVVLPPNKQFIVLFNPFNAAIDMVRAPLLGTLPSTTSFMMMLVVTVFGAVICFKMFTAYRARIVYWL